MKTNTERYMEWRAKNPEKAKALQARYRKAHREEILEKRRVYAKKRYATNAEVRRKAIDAATEWRKKNPEKQKASVAKWNKKHPEKLKEYLKRYYDKHAEELKAKRRERYRKQKEIDS